MFRNFIESIFSKGLISISNFLTVILTAQFLGTEGRGEIALIILAVSIVGLVQNIAGGSAISFYSGKLATSSILFISFLWLVFTAVSVPFLMDVCTLSPPGWMGEIMALSFLLGAGSIFQYFYLGLEKIRLFNLLELVKAVLVILLILLHFFVFGEINLPAVVRSYLLAYLICFLTSFSYSFRILKRDKPQDLVLTGKKLFKTGLELQVNNILQLINYRFTFFIIEKYLGLSVLGIVSVTVSLAEAVWIICKSAATVLYVRILNETDDTKKTGITVQFTKMSYLSTSVACVLLLLVPISWYQYLFGKDFTGIRELLLCYSPSIIFLSFFTILNHYFTVQNQNRINIYATFLGNIIVIVLGFILIPRFGILASGLVISLAYLLMLVYLLLVFNWYTKSRWVYFFTNFGGLRSIIKDV